MQKVTAGRDILGDFVPKFAELNDDALFGQVWSREAQLSPRDHSIITVTALMASGVLDSSLQSHMERAKSNGVTKEEMAELLYVPFQNNSSFKAGTADSKPQSERYALWFSYTLFTSSFS
ncbi:carboxymuconolactone decarboxylase family protein [Lacrimispora sp.]|uniref:carboxymuconolactone decarboxylase family protein n=1 Tax=Lacrimispora sp. TaxID=2719234 RepID=UPI00345F2728